MLDLSYCYISSDQTDPFNRQPLTMEEIQTNEELKERIEKWKKENTKQKEWNSIVSMIWFSFNSICNRWFLILI